MMQGSPIWIGPSNGNVLLFPCPHVVDCEAHREAVNSARGLLHLRAVLISSAIILSRGGNAAMGNLSIAVQQLKQERERIRREGQRIDAALLALGNVSSNGAARQHTMPAAARRRISLAQKARWAKQKATTQPARPKRTLSAAGRRRIIAAQRARWAKVRRAGK